MLPLSWRMLREKPAPLMPPRDAAPVEWRISDALVPYADAVAFMDARVAAIAAGAAPELIWLLEHPALYTAGTSARATDLVRACFPVHNSGRGGQFTYHGPGQRVIYVMLDLNRRNPDLRAFVRGLEDWIIAALHTFAVKGEPRADRVGVWVSRPEKARGKGGEIAEDKIAAIGIRGTALGVVPWHIAQYRAGPCALFRHRALRHFGRAFWGDEPSRSWPEGRH